MRLVAPFRPFPPESSHHVALADFDWLQAIQMLQHTASVACACPFHVLTDVDTDLPMPVLRYRTIQRRLMLWTLEVCACYVESDDFDQDTVMLDCDQLVYRDLAPWFAEGIDLGVLVRTGKLAERQPLLNGVQWWAHAAKDRLAAFYRQALAVAVALPEDQIVWGADTDAMRAVLEPCAVGVQDRAGLRVAMIASAEVLHSLTRADARDVIIGAPIVPPAAVIDFRFFRKRSMAGYYAATLGVPA